MEKYIVRCLCGKYESGPMAQSTCKIAGNMHEMLGPEHKCEVIKIKD